MSTMSLGNFTKNAPFCHSSWFAFSSHSVLIVICMFFSVSCVDIDSLLKLIVAKEYGDS